MVEFIVHFLTGMRVIEVARKWIFFLMVKDSVAGE